MTLAPTPTRGPGSHRGPLLVLPALAIVLIAVVVVLLLRSDVFTSSTAGSVEQGSGIPATEARQVRAFDRVELAGSAIVTIRVGGARSVVVQADDNLIDRVTTRVDTRRLVIGSRGGGFTTGTPIRVEITVPSLTELTLSGSGTIAVDRLAAAALAVTASGSGVVHATGTVSTLRVLLSGSGDLQLGRLRARDVRATVSGSGRILVTATERLDALVSGSGAIVYGGRPTELTTNVTGSGAITRG